MGREYWFVDLLDFTSQPRLTKKKRERELNRRCPFSVLLSRFFQGCFVKRARKRSEAKTERRGQG